MLKDIHEPGDLKRLRPAELDLLAEELRREIVKVTSEQGGHLASNLGVVELTLALHYVLNCPEDKLVFDVGERAASPAFRRANTTHLPPATRPPRFRPRWAWRARAM